MIIGDTPLDLDCARRLLCSAVPSPRHHLPHDSPPRPPTSLHRRLRRRRTPPRSPPADSPGTVVVVLPALRVAFGGVMYQRTAHALLPRGRPSLPSRTPPAARVRHVDRGSVSTLRLYNITQLGRSRGSCTARRHALSPVRPRHHRRRSAASATRAPAIRRRPAGRREAAPYSGDRYHCIRARSRRDVMYLVGDLARALRRSLLGESAHAETLRDHVTCSTSAGASEFLSPSVPSRTRLLFPAT